MPVTPEWFFSKLLETVRAAPEVYDAADRFIEAGDWIVWQLCGQERRNLSAAGFKAMWVHPSPGTPDERPSVEKNSATGSAAGESQRSPNAWTYPSKRFFKALHSKMENVVADKLQADLHPLGSKAGGLTAEMARITGLRPGRCG